MTNDTFRTWWRLFAQRWDRAGQPELAAFYYGELKAMPDDAFVRAARQALRKLQFFPTVEELEAFAGTEKATAASAWERVLPLLRNSSSPLDSLDEPAKRAVRTMGGLAVIGQDASAIHFRRSEFCDLYEQFAGGDEGPPPLTGEGRRVIEQAMAGGVSGNERSGAPGRLPATNKA